MELGQCNKTNSKPYVRVPIITKFVHFYFYLRKFIAIQNKFNVIYFLCRVGNKPLSDQRNIAMSKTE